MSENAIKSNLMIDPTDFGIWLWYDKNLVAHS